MSLNNKEIDNNNTDKVELNQELSQVATHNKRNFLVLIFIGAIGVYLFFNYFLENKSNNNNDNLVPDKVEKPIEESSNTFYIPPAPTLPPPPKIDDIVTAPPPAPSMVIDSPEATTQEQPKEKKLDLNPVLPNVKELPPLPGFNNKSNGDISTSDNKYIEEQNRKNDKRKSSIMLLDGSQSSSQSTSGAIISTENTKNSLLNKKGDMSLLLAQGKIIDAITETVIDTNFGGQIKAIINRDVYSELGKNILIPKGSKIYGRYNTGLSSIYRRVIIEWVKLDLPNGYVLQLTSQGVDSLGRKGIEGMLDHKLESRLGNIVLISAINIASGWLVDKIIPPKKDGQESISLHNKSNSIRTIAISASAENNNINRSEVCTKTLGIINDHTLKAYKMIKDACDALDIETGGSTEKEKLNSILHTIHSAADSLLVDTGSQIEETKSQKEAREGFDDFVDELKDFVEESKIKPNIIIDQGTLIKIYINQDYIFPKEVINKKW